MSAHPRRHRGDLDIAHGRRHIALAQGAADRHAPGVEEGIGHAAADGQMVDLVHEIAEQLDLGRDLGPTDDRGQGPRRVIERTAEALELRLHQAPRRGGQEPGQRLGRGMGAVGGGEGVVDIGVAERGEGLGEIGIVGFLAGMEAEVFQERYLSIAETGHHRRGLRPDAIPGEGDWSAAQRRSKGRGHLAQGEGRVDGAPGPAEMGHEDDPRALRGQLRDRGCQAIKARRVRDSAAIQRHVQVGAHEYPAAPYVEIIEDLERGHGLEPEALTEVTLAREP